MYLAPWWASAASSGASSLRARTYATHQDLRVRAVAFETLLSHSVASVRRLTPMNRYDHSPSRIPPESERRGPGRGIYETGLNPYSFAAFNPMTFSLADRLISSRSRSILICFALCMSQWG